MADLVKGMAFALGILCKCVEDLYECPSIMSHIFFPMQEYVDDKGVKHLPRRAAHPFYHVLVDAHDKIGPNTWMAEDNFELAQDAVARRQQQGHQAEQEAPWADQSTTLEVEHPRIGELFDGFDLQTARYQPNAYMRFRYPDD